MHPCLRARHIQAHTCICRSTAQPSNVEKRIKALLDRCNFLLTFFVMLYICILSTFSFIFFFVICHSATSFQIAGRSASVEPLIPSRKPRRRSRSENARTQCLFLHSFLTTQNLASLVLMNVNRGMDSVVAEAFRYLASSEKVPLQGTVASHFTT